MTYSDEDMRRVADSGEQALAHYGVKGMKWGVRAAASGEVNPALSRNRTTAIKKARNSVDSQKAKIKAATTKSEKKELRTKLEQDPSFVAARLKTRGEKVAMTSLTVVGAIGYSALMDHLDSSAQSSFDKSLGKPSEPGAFDTGDAFNPDATLDRSRIRDVS